MLETLRLLRKEIDSLLLILRTGPARVSVGDPLIKRLQFLAYTWSFSIRLQLQVMGIPLEVLNRAEEASSQLARLTAHTTTAKQYRSALAHFREILTKQVLLEFSGLPLAARLATATPAIQKVNSEIPDLPNAFIPNALVGWTHKLQSFLNLHSFDKNVFVMTSYKPQLAPLLKRVKKALIELELDPIVASEHHITDDLYNPIACLLCCSYGLAIFDRAETHQRHNPNVVYELGMMDILKRPCVILKHKKLSKMPSDLLSRLYQGYGSNDEAVKKINAWWERENAH